MNKFTEQFTRVVDPLAGWRARWGKSAKISASKKITRRTREFSTRNERRRGYFSVTRVALSVDTSSRTKRNALPTCESNGPILATWPGIVSIPYLADTFAPSSLGGQTGSKACKPILRKYRLVNVHTSTHLSNWFHVLMCTYRIEPDFYKDYAICTRIICTTLLLDIYTAMRDRGWG